MTVYSDGAEVTTVSNLREHNGVYWGNVEQADLSLPGVWIIQRDPELVYSFPDPHPGQILLFAMHDFDHDIFRGGTRQNWGIKYDAILCESHIHAQVTRLRYPGANVVMTGSGFMLDRIGEMPVVERNPKRIMYSSSPLRGLLQALQIYRRAKEEVPDLEFYITFGWDYIDHLIKTGQNASEFQSIKDGIMKMIELTGAIHMGRLPTPYDVHVEYMKSGIWLFPTTFKEIACNSLMESQAFGAIPIASPAWAVGENLLHGIRIPGDPAADRLVQARFVRELVALATRPELQDQIRPDMMRDARERFNFVDTASRIETVSSQLYESKEVNEEKVAYA